MHAAKKNQPDFSGFSSRAAGAEGREEEEGAGEGVEREERLRVSPPLSRLTISESQ